MDEQGNVLYLDQERLDRKEVGFPPYKNKSNGTGFYNRLPENVIYMSKKRWPLALKLYKMFIKFSPWMKEVCVGCGICASRCHLDVIEIKQTMPMRESIQEYDCDKVVEYAKMRNPGIEVIFVCARDGEGVSAVADWIVRNVKEWTK